MIVYGTRATLTKSELIAESCPHCNTHGSVQMNVFQRYAHIFWIPFFPIGKTGVSQCQHCKQVLKLKEMPATLKLSYDNLKAHTRIPVWHFSGVFVVILISIYVTIHGNQQRQQTDQFAASPKANDILQVKAKDEKTKDDVYTLIKITKVAGDSVYFCYNKYQSDQADGITGTQKNEFEDELRVMPKSELAEMNKKGDIIDIDRN